MVFFLGFYIKGLKFEGFKMVKFVKKFMDIEIKSIKFLDKEINLFDGDGLMLRIVFFLRGGKKNWYFRYVVLVIKK